MTTAIGLITRAMRLARVTGEGEIVSDTQAADGLSSLNAMLDSWQIKRLFVYQIRSEPFTWTANEQSQTVGPTGDFVTDLPTQVSDNLTFEINSISYVVKQIDVDAWNNIPNKSTISSFPWWIYVEYGATLVTLNAYPIPNANATINLTTWKRLQQFTSLTDVMVLPPGNERAIAYSLAEELSPEYGLDVMPRVSRIAKEARDNLRRVNSPSPIMMTEAGYMSRRYTSYIYGDWP